MTDNEIIKALECCANNGDCKECAINPHKGNYGYCTSLAIKQALDLINRQKAEIERKEKELVAFSKWNKDYEAEIYELRKSLLSKENLEESFSKSVKQFDKKLAKTVKLERAEAVKEFAERLKDYYTKKKIYDRPNAHTLIGFLFSLIDDIAEEMVGAESG